MDHLAIVSVPVSYSAAPFQYSFGLYLLSKLDKNFS